MENVPYAAFTNGEVRKPPAVVPDRNYSPLARSTIKEHSTITASAVFFIQRHTVNCVKLGIPHMST